MRKAGAETPVIKALKTPALARERSPLAKVSQKFSLSGNYHSMKKTF